MFIGMEQKMESDPSWLRLTLNVQLYSMFLKQGEDALQETEGERVCSVLS